MNKSKKTTLFIIGVILTSICLRGPIASVGSLISSMESDLGVSKGHLGFITTLPLLVFAVSSLVIPKIANKIGHTRILIIGMLLLAAGSFTRTLAGYFVVLAGTLLVGIGISVGNVLISAIIKENMPLKIGLATGIYLCFQNLSATMAAGLSYPLAVSVDLGWRNTLALWAIPGVLAAAAWVVFGINNKINEQRLDQPVTVGQKSTVLWKSGLAWSITIVMGVQSVCYYCITAWLPSILEATGMNFETAGYVASAFQLFAIPATFIAPIVIAHTKNKSLPAILSGVFYIVGILIIMFTDSIPVILVGLFFLATGGGASFAWVVAIIAIVSKDSHEATRLSGMAQSLGYVMAAVAPTLAGALFDMTESWFSVMAMVILMSVMIIIFSYTTGRMLKKSHVL